MDSEELGAGVVQRIWVAVVLVVAAAPNGQLALVARAEAVESSVARERREVGSEMAVGSATRATAVAAMEVACNT